MQRGGRITKGEEHSNPFLLGVSSSSPVQPSFYPFFWGVPFVVRNNLSSVLSIHTHNLKHEAQPYAAGSW